MEKRSIQSVAEILVEKATVTKKASVGFATAMFEVIQEGLDRDGIVKVKGLGTFKVIDVEDRESVNVNTGERVLISGHSKITFTPDTTMKELVNRPFSQFETVILNDGVSFEDMAAEQAAAEAEAFPESNAPIEKFFEGEESEKEASKDQHIVDEESVAQEESIDPEENDETVEFTVTEEELAVIEEETVQKEEKADEPVAIEPMMAESEINEPVVIETSTDKSVLWLLPFVVILLIGTTCAGYWYGRQSVIEEMAIQPEQQALVVEDAIANDTIEKVAVNPTAVVDTTEVSTQQEVQEPVEPVKVEQPKPAKQPKPVEQPKPVDQPKKVEQSQTSAFDQYEKMDSRVRTGAYKIIGTAEVITVKPGQTLKRLSRTYLGEGMECYMEVYNGISVDTPLKVGQQIKIPKLITKKRLKQQQKK